MSGSASQGAKRKGRATRTELAPPGDAHLKRKPERGEKASLRLASKFDSYECLIWLETAFAERAGLVGVKHLVAQKPFNLPMRMPKVRPAARRKPAPRLMLRSARLASRTEASRLPLSFLVISSRASTPLSVHVKPRIASVLALRPFAVEARSLRRRASERSRSWWSCFAVCGSPICATPRSRVVRIAVSEPEEPHPGKTSRARAAAIATARCIE